MPYFLISGSLRPWGSTSCARAPGDIQGATISFSPDYFHNHFLLLWPGRLLPTFWGSTLFSPRIILVSRSGEGQKLRRGCGHNVPPKRNFLLWGNVYSAAHALAYFVFNWPKSILSWFHPQAALCNSSYSNMCLGIEVLYVANGLILLWSSKTQPLVLLARLKSILPLQPCYQVVRKAGLRPNSATCTDIN